MRNRQKGVNFCVVKKESKYRKKCLTLGEEKIFNFDLFDFFKK